MKRTRFPSLFLPFWHLRASFRSSSLLQNSPGFIPCLCWRSLLFQDEGEAALGAPCRWRQAARRSADRRAARSSGHGPAGPAHVLAPPPALRKRSHPLRPAALSAESAGASIWALHIPAWVHGPGVPHRCAISPYPVKGAEGTLKAEGPRSCHCSFHRTCAEATKAEGLRPAGLSAKLGSAPGQARDQNCVLQTSPGLAACPLLVRSLVHWL